HANLGLVFTAREQWQDAVASLEPAVDALRRLDRHPWLVAFLTCLAVAYAGDGQWKSARRAFDEALALDAEIPVDDDEFLDAAAAFADIAAEQLPEQAAQARELVETRTSGDL